MIGLCIKYFHENYGGMLQALATTKILEERKLEYELIRYDKKKSAYFILKSIPRLLNPILVNDKYESIKKRIGYYKHPEFKQNDEVRLKAFDKFRKRNFKYLSKVYKDYRSLKVGAMKYSAVITGSDQLWSPAGLPTNFYNLMFVPMNIKKISYASSFGVKQIPFYQRKRTKKYLQRLDYISMREQRGCEIVNELIARRVPVVLDPVCMFNREGWERLIPSKIVINEPYIFAYLLGNNQEHRNKINELAKKINMKIVTLRHLDQYIDEDEKFGDYAPYDIGPADFLNLLRGAKYVCTDSFHGSCFSIIHEKQFIVFNRYDDKSKNSKNSRIDTLCKTLGLSDRRYSSDIYSEMMRPIDYITVNKRLHTLRQAADKYLDVAFCGISNKK